MTTIEKREILLIECFYGGSHKQMMDLLYAEIPGCDLVTLPAKKWHWRARTGALCIAEHIPLQHNYKYMSSSIFEFFMKDHNKYSTTAKFTINVIL